MGRHTEKNQGKLVKSLSFRDIDSACRCVCSRLSVPIASSSTQRRRAVVPVEPSRGARGNDKRGRGETTTIGYVTLLSDRDIRAELDSGRIALDPYDPSLIQPASVDVCLDRYFRLFDNHKYPVIDPSLEQPELTRFVEAAPGEPFVLHPGEFVLASTHELVTLPEDVAARLEGKSSLGRLGLLTHSTAGFIDPGFSGHVTLELSNVATLPITLWPGMKIGQLCFFRLSSAAINPYGSQATGNRYQGQRGPTASRSHLNFYRRDM